jgi:pimeloyl-ACP methyl ester carboxylesterase
MKKTIDRAEYNGISYLYKEGVGTPLLLFHGISSDAETFRGVMMAVRNPVYAFDMAGYGASKPVAKYNDYIDIIVNFLAAQPTKCHLLGSSLGALVSAKIALKLPSKVESLIFVGAALGYGLRDGDLRPESITARIEGLRVEPPQEYAAKRAPRLIYKPETKPDVLKSAIRAMSNIRLAGLEPASELLASADLIADIQTLNIPIHIFVGEGDVIAPPSNARKLAVAAGENLHSFNIIKNAGHALVQETPDFLKDIL